jgi:hypothetical protein
LTFTLQANSPTALGFGGGALGYQGIGMSVAIKFDIWDNKLNFRRVHMRHGQSPEGPIRFGHVHDAPIGKEGHGEPGDLPHGAGIVHDGGEGTASFGQEPQSRLAFP